MDIIRSGITVASTFLRVRYVGGICHSASTFLTESLFTACPLVMTGVTSYKESLCRSELLERVQTLPNHASPYSAADQAIPQLML